MSILGLTIDYGPYGWVDNFDPAWTPNTTDADGRRYCFARQPEIARWNLQRLSEALAVLAPEPGALAQGLACFDETYADEFNRALIAKFGLAQCEAEDAALIESAFALLHQAEVDMSLFFRALARVDVQAPELAILKAAFYREELYDRHAGDFSAWLARWAARVQLGGIQSDARVARMNAVNPCYVLRNYLAQEAIDRAEQGDAAMIHELLEVLRRPYDEQPGREAFAAKRPEWARHKAGCSMLSCSS